MSYVRINRHLPINFQLDALASAPGRVSPYEVMEITRVARDYIDQANRDIRFLQEEVGRLRETVAALRRPLPIYHYV